MSICAPFQNACLISGFVFCFGGFLKSGFILLFARSKHCTSHVSVKDRTAEAGDGEGIDRDERRKEIKNIVMAS